MKRFTLFLLPLAVVAAGCTTTSVHYVDELEFADRLNERQPGESAEFVMKTGERFEAREFEVKGDSVRFVADRPSWSGAPSGRQMVSLRTIRSFTLTDHGKGAMEGLKRGATGGLALVAAMAVTDEQGYALVGSLIAAPFIVVAGLLHGAAHGKKHRFELEPEPQKDFRRSKLTVFEEVIIEAVHTAVRRRGIPDGARKGGWGRPSEDGRWQMEDGRWKVADGRWKMAERRRNF